MRPEEVPRERVLEMMLPLLETPRSDDREEDPFARLPTADGDEPLEGFELVGRLLGLLLVGRDPDEGR